MNIAISCMRVTCLDASGCQILFCHVYSNKANQYKFHCWGFVIECIPILYVNTTCYVIRPHVGLIKITGSWHYNGPNTI